MASVHEKPDYPRRLYEPGKCPFLKHSTNHNCSFAKLGTVRESLGDDVWESLKKTSVGVILKLASKKFIFSALTVHHFITNQLQTTKPHEIWSLIGDEPVRFSMNEFADITGLNCSPFDEEDKLVVSHKEFWEEMGVSTSHGPCWDELAEVLSQCSTWSINKKKMVGLLCVLSIGIYGISPSSRIPLESAKRVLDFKAFERYPWGRVACDSLINGVKVLTFQNDSYVVKGFVHVLQVWAYESVAVIGEKLGNARDKFENEPLLRWKGSRIRFKYPGILESEIKKHTKVRVRNMFPESKTELYPQWDDDVHDTKVDNLIGDLVNKKYCRNFYKEVETRKLEKRKSRAHNSPCKKSKVGIEGVEEEGTSRNDEVPTHSEGVHIEQDKKSCSKKDPVVANVDFSQMLKDFGQTMLTSMETTIGKTVLGLEESLRAKIASDQAVRMEAYDSRLEKMETMVADINKRLQVSGCTEVHVMAKDEKKAESSMAKDDKKAESSSKTPSWLVCNVQTSEEKYPISCAVNKKSTGRTKKSISTEVSSALRYDTFNAILDAQNSKENVVNSLLDTMLHLLQDKGGKDVDDKRRVQRAGTQVHPFVGNSTVRRLIPDVIIDPSSLVQPESQQRLFDFIRENESAPIGKNRGMKYLRLMTPKKLWPKNDLGFGWLHDGHMEDIMKMFTQRSMSHVSPYRSQRIAFLDPSFVRLWVDDLAQFELGPKKFNFPAGYKDVFNGNYDVSTQTNRKWYVDVDNLYITHHIRSDHWAALDINLKEERIDVYDSIPSLTRNNEVIQSCRPFAKMIPFLLNLLVPPAIRKRKMAMFAVNRVKNIPENIDVGDCGVYAVKYIERLALGENFEGLCDANMPAFRLQLACDTFAEVPVPKFTIETPSLKDEDIELLDGNPFE